MRLSIICGLVVTVCTGIALTVPGFAQLRGSSPGISSPAFTPSNKTLEFENEQRRKKSFDDNLFKNQDLKTKNQDLKAKDTKLDKPSKSTEPELKTEKTKSKDVNLIKGKDHDLKPDKETKTGDPEKGAVTKIVVTTGAESKDVGLLKGCESRGGSASQCTKAIQECSAAKGGATSTCVEGAERLMAGCSGSPGKGGGASIREGGGGLGLDAGACGSAIQACIAKGDASAACVNDQAIASLSGTKENKNDAQLLQGCERKGNSPSECLKAIKDCSAKGSSETSGCVDKAATEQKELMAGCSGSPRGGASGKAGVGGLGLDAGACQKAVDACIAKGDATSSCVNDQAMGIVVAENTTGGTNGSTDSGQTDPTGQTGPTGPAPGWNLTTTTKQ
jgi:hypothetical protein